MKKEMEFQNKENYVTPELEVMELATECVMIDSSGEETW